MPKTSMGFCLNWLAISVGQTMQQAAPSADGALPVTRRYWVVLGLNGARRYSMGSS